jgi:hypothetical protein
MRKTKRVFDVNEKKEWIQWKKCRQEKDGKKCGLGNELEVIPNAPTLKQLRIWEKLELEGHNLDIITENWGAPSKLTPGEKEVLAGWVLLREQSEKVTSGQNIIDFVQRNFGETVEKTWVSHTMASLGFSSQRVKGSKSSHPAIKYLPDVKHFIGEIRDLLDDGIESSRLVAEDEVAFWNSGVYLRSYAMRGG